MFSKYDSVYRSKRGIRKEMIQDILGYIAITAFIIALFVVVFMLWNYVSAENFTFNMTEELIAEERVLQTCREFNIKSDECSMIYGNTNNSVDDGRIESMDPLQ